MELLKLLSANEIVAEVISFLILFFILRALVWNKILKLLDDRRKRIADEFNNIENTKLEFANLKADYENKLSKIEDTAKTAIKEALKEAGVMAESVRKQAYVDADKIIENAKNQIALELHQAKTELRDQIINLAITASEKIVKEKMNDEYDKKLVADFIERLDNVK